MNPTSNHTTQPDRHLQMVDALSRAVAAVTSELSLPRTLQAIVDIARELAEARYAALGVPNDDGTLKAFITSGMEATTAAAIGHEPRGRGLLGAILESDEPIRLDNLHEDPRSAGFCENHPEMTRMLGVPIISRGERLGNLYLTDPLDGEPFSEDDERMIVLLAKHAAIAIENARLSEQLQKLAQSRERDRIGMELHDGVIQSVYAVGMKLEIMRGQFPMTPDQEQQYQGIIEDLNQIIEDIRLYIRNLRTARDEQATFGQRLDNLARHFKDFSQVDVVLDVPSSLRTLNEKQRHSLSQIAREALSNVARHAEATQVRVKVREVGSNLVMTISDNGKGFNPDKIDNPNSFGLRNMDQRARRLGGTLLIESDDHGTTISVQIPFRP